MKFCKLQRTISEFADPEWALYWTDYKNLKKIIKDLPHNNVSACSSPIDIRLRMEKCPGEIAFFKLLHSEFRKVSTFFEKKLQELTQQEKKVQAGLEGLKSPASGRILDYEKYSTIAKSIYLLHRDELLLELYAIMSYISFSKILKKHDKNTGYSTSAAFMSNLVNKANFAHYPDLTSMIQRSEEMFDSFLQQIPVEGPKILGDDEKLFISMIHRFYGQILDEAGKDVAPNAVPLLRRRSEHGDSEH